MQFIIKILVLWTKNVCDKYGGIPGVAHIADAVDLHVVFIDQRLDLTGLVPVGLRLPVEGDAVDPVLIRKRLVRGDQCQIGEGLREDKDLTVDILVTQLGVSGILEFGAETPVRDLTEIQ